MVWVTHLLGRFTLCGSCDCLEYFQYITRVANSRLSPRDSLPLALATDVIPRKAMRTEQKEPLYHAKRELAAAEKAIERMTKAESIDDLEDEWKVYLNSIEKCWVKTERACQHVRNKFQPWQGEFSNERKKDALLRYIKHARNSDQHSIQEAMQKKEASSSMYVEGGQGVTHIERLEIRNGRLVEYRGNQPLIIENLPNRVELIPVKDGNKWYNPPKQHKDVKLLWPAPVDVAVLGLEYYRNFIRLAEEKFFDKV